MNYQTAEQERDPLDGHIQNTESCVSCTDVQHLHVVTKL
jgi:hypothetical protein